jgi:hypothetical protein
MSVSIIPAAPGTFAICQRSHHDTRERSPELVIAWQIYSDHDQEDLGALSVTPIGVDGRICNLIRVVQGGSNG